MKKKPVANLEMHILGTNLIPVRQTLGPRKRKKNLDLIIAQLQFRKQRASAWIMPYN